MKKPFMERIATFIVDKRNLFVALFAALSILSIFTVNSVKVNEDLADYLPDHVETRQGLEIMNKEFVTYGEARVMVSNITYRKAEELAETLRGLDGVKEVRLSDDDSHYKDAAVLFDLVFDGGDFDDVSIRGVANVREALSGYDTYISTKIGNPIGVVLEREMNMVLVIVGFIIVLVLLLTSRTYAEVPVLLVVFGISVWVNKGTNALFGEISFVTDSIAAVLQLGLAVDYAIILCHHFTEEREHREPREAIIRSLTMAIPEISASSLTTMSGLLALAFMKIKIGEDMSFILIKAILISMLTVFLLMPALLLLMSKLIDRSHHKNFVPRIDCVGRFAIKTRYIVPPIFAVLLIASSVLSSHCPFVFGYSNLDTFKQNEYKLAEKKINTTFGEVNRVALILPFSDYATEKALYEDLSNMDGIDRIDALTGIEAKDGYNVADALGPREFAELASLDLSVSRTLYRAYCAQNETFAQALGQLVDLSNIDNCTVPLIDMMKFVYDQRDAYKSLIPASKMDEIEDMHDRLIDGERQLHSENYSRMILYLNLPIEDQQTFDYMTVLRGVVGRHYTQFYFAGDTTQVRDFSEAFREDNLLTSILTIVFVVAILLLTFKSVALPLLLILVIQGSVWMNFSFPALANQQLYFLSYLIVGAIMMGANIDYAIVISSRYLSLKQTKPYKEAMVEALNFAFPTVITSGSILAAAGLAIGIFSSENTVSAIGICLGRGTLISMLLVLCVLPQVLLLGDSIVEKTSFSLGGRAQQKNLTGAMRVNGRVRGYINGYIDADVRGYVNGTVSASIDIGCMERAEAEEQTAIPGPEAPPDGRKPAAQPGEPLPDESDVPDKEDCHETK